MSSSLVCVCVCVCVQYVYLHTFSSIDFLLMENTALYERVRVITWIVLIFSVCRTSNWKLFFSCTMLNWFECSKITHSVPRSLPTTGTWAANLDFGCVAMTTCFFAFFFLSHVGFPWDCCRNVARSRSAEPELTREAARQLWDIIKIAQFDWYSAEHLGLLVTSQRELESLWS